jgi:hypothetical protein
MTLLINGCSFAECWRPSAEFVSELNCDNVINIGKVGTSFQRTVRSTIEWIAQNGKPNYIVIPITLGHRWELAISHNEDSIDGTWYPLQRKELIDQNKISPLVSVGKIQSLIDLYYGSIPDIRTHWDKCFTEIIMLAGWLENERIPYLMFDMCNQFDRKHLKGYKGFEKLKFIDQNKNIIDIFDFCGNEFMWRSLSADDKKNIDPVLYHHRDPQYRILENYLLNYIKSCAK